MPYWARGIIRTETWVHSFDEGKRVIRASLTVIVAALFGLVLAGASGCGEPSQDDLEEEKRDSFSPQLEYSLGDTMRAKINDRDKREWDKLVAKGAWTGFPRWTQIEYAACIPAETRSTAPNGSKRYSCRIRYTNSRNLLYPKYEMTRAFDVKLTSNERCWKARMKSASRYEKAVKQTVPQVVRRDVNRSLKNCLEGGRSNGPITDEIDPDVKDTSISIVGSELGGYDGYEVEEFSQQPDEELRLEEGEIIKLRWTGWGDSSAKATGVWAEWICPEDPESDQLCKKRLKKGWTAEIDVSDRIRCRKYSDDSYRYQKLSVIVRANGRYVTTLRPRLYPC